jgi:hypothetical protein
MDSVHVSAPQDDDDELYYPDSEVHPIENSTLQAEYVATTKSGLEVLFVGLSHIHLARG